MTDKPSTSKASSSETSETSEYDPCLDFYSDKFDPLKALQASHIKLPVPDAPILDNLAKYEAVHLHGKKTFVTEAKESAAELKFKRRFLPHQMPIPSKKRVKKNISTRMENFKGPIAVLKTCVDQRRRLKVWTRHSHGIRGYCSAFCVAFDKHWNLALEDVTEVWTRPRSRKVAALDSLEIQPKKTVVRREGMPSKITIVKTSRNQELCRRYAPQLMIRGEQVAFINIIRIQ